MNRDAALFLTIMAGLLILACVLWGGHCDAVTLAWGASTGADGYRLYYGQAPGTYSVIMEVGASLQAAVGGLTPGVIYYFAATAYNASGESGYSNEVAWTEPVMPPPPPPIPAPPVIHLVTPTNGQGVPRRGVVPIAVALDAGGPLDWLDILVDGTRLCRDLSTPYGCDWSVPPANQRTYRLQARAADTAGQVGLSSIVEVISE